MNRSLQAIFDSRAPSPLRVAALLSVMAFHSPAFAQETAPAKAQQPQPQASAARETPAKVAAGVEPVEVNVLPLRVVAARFEALLRKGQTDPHANFEVKVAADRLEDGTLDNVVFDSGSASGEDAQVLRQFVNALSQSKVLGFMRDVPSIQFALQVKEDVFIRLSGEAATKESAGMMAQGYGALLDTASQAKKGTDEGQLLAATKTHADGKLLTLTFRMPRAVFADMLSRVRRPE